LLVEAVGALGDVVADGADASSDGLAKRAAATVVSLWLAHPDDAGATASVANCVARCAGSQILAFEPLLYQLSSRLAAHGAGFQKVLADLLKKLAAAAPARTVLQIVALANGGQVDETDRGAAAFEANLEGPAAARVAAARKLQQALRKGASAKLVDGLASLADAYVDLAMAPTEPVRVRARRGDFREDAMPFSAFVVTGPGLDAKAKQLARASVLPVVTRLNDADAPELAGFAPTLKLTETGIHRPKIVECVDAAGVKHRQLVKGKDDVRQDAVMQQVFEAVNDLLQRSTRRARGLRLRTYAIVPLSPQAGVLEWVRHTLPFGAYLSDRGRARGAHGRYFPGDLAHSECRKRLDGVRQQPRSKKRKALDDMFRRFRPAFRFFFLEYFGDARAWLAARDAYTRSVATNAMIGHVLGIGDRHAMNILVDCRTGEQVHIDFGIAFDQGKTLTQPETVPFRLTRDVVDGMGAHGTRGAFTAAAVDTATELRAHSGQLTTILDVLIHDPLYKWMLSPRDAQRKQRDDDDDERSGGGDNAADNQAAARALLVVKQKLQGYSDATHDVLSVEGQVTQLIAEATDRDNLCVLFAGWAPWL